MYGWLCCKGSILKIVSHNAGWTKIAKKNRRFGQKHAVVGINFAFFELRHRKDCNQPAHECNERVSAFVFRKNRCPQQGLCGQIYNFFASYAKYGALGAFEIRLCSHCWI